MYFFKAFDRLLVATFCSLPICDVHMISLQSDVHSSGSAVSMEV